MKLLISALYILSIISVVYSYRYQATISLGSGKKFEDVEGSLKLKIHGQYSADIFRLIQS